MYVCVCVCTPERAVWFSVLAVRVSEDIPKLSSLFMTKQVSDVTWIRVIKVVN